MYTQMTWADKNETRLRMLKEFDAFCRTHGIRYSLASGTLLGAIRHKGFIPWDDDMDIMMPMPDLERTKEEFFSENIELIDLDNDKYYAFPFPRLIDKHSFSRPGKSIIGHGVSIDVYPLVGAPSSQTDLHRFYRKSSKWLKIRLLMMKWRSRIIRRYAIKTLPLFRKIQLKYRSIVCSCPYDSAARFLLLSGRPDKEHTYDFDLFESMIDIKFENMIFMSISRYEDYLRQRYGDYMKLPPEEDRRPYHGGVYYKY